MNRNESISENCFLNIKYQFAIKFHGKPQAVCSDFALKLFFLLSGPTGNSATLSYMLTYAQLRAVEMVSKDIA